MPAMSAQTVRHARAGTRVVATIGPASAGEDILHALIEAGLDVARINLSHGSRADHERMYTRIRRLTESLDRPVAVLADLCGPKVRLGTLAGGSFELAAGARLRIAAGVSAGGPDGVGINQPQILADIRPRHRVLIDDGAIRLRAETAGPDEIVCLCEIGGTVRERKGVNLPDSDLRLPALTDKDLDDAAWAIGVGVDFLGLSFVRRAADVTHLREFIRDKGADVPIVTKLETPQAVAQLGEIVTASDALMVARGDLGVEVDLAEVPRLQKEMIDFARRAGKPVIVATQMLQSMIESPTPTRAEASDVANAILDGADAVMLSGETAVGKYPVEAVRMLQRIAQETEKYDHLRCTQHDANAEESGVAAAVAESVPLLVKRVGARAVAVWTRHGRLARLVSKHRLDLPVVALAASEAVRRRLALSYGIIPFVVEKPAELADQVRKVEELLLLHGFANLGDRLVIGLGPNSFGEGDSGSLTIHSVGSR
jgi:pyruvate kinase